MGNAFSVVRILPWRRQSLAMFLCSLLLFRSVLSHQRVSEWERKSLSRRKLFNRWKNLKRLSVLWGMPFSPILLFFHVLAIQYLLWKCFTFRGGRFVYIPGILAALLSNSWAYYQISWVANQHSLPVIGNNLEDMNVVTQYSLVDFILEHVDSMPAEVLHSADAQLNAISGTCLCFAISWIIVRCVINGNFVRTLNGLEILTGTGACGVTAGIAALVGYIVIGIIRNESCELETLLNDLVRNFENSKSEEEIKILLQKLKDKCGNLILRGQLQQRLQKPWNELRVLTTFCTSRAIFQIIPIPLRWMKQHKISAWTLLEATKWASCLLYVTSITNLVSQETRRLEALVEKARSRILEAMLTSEQGDLALRVSIYLEMLKGKIHNNPLSLPELEFLIWLQKSKGPRWILLCSGSIATIVANIRW